MKEQINWSTQQLEDSETMNQANVITTIKETGQAKNFMATVNQHPC